MILIEAESFDKLGGWLVDSQFIDQMGSAYLLAHGLGVPVDDAATKFVADAGDYRLWVRTRDWASGAGRFDVIVNGGYVGEFGVGDSEWGWIDGGILSLNSGGNEVRLHDLTGFDARCDALLFVETERCFIPERNPTWEWRKTLLGMPEKPVEEKYDFAVVGGGYAGMCAAVAAARRGVKVVLVQDRPVFGGNASSEVRVGPIGRLGLPPYPRLSDLAFELMVVTGDGGTSSGGLRSKPNDRNIFEWLEKEENLTLYVGCRCVSVGREQNGMISRIGIRNVRTGEEHTIIAAFFADCTGEGRLAELAGAIVRISPEPNEKLLGWYGSTNFWTTKWTDHETPFPACPWALPITDENCQISPPRSDVKGDFPYVAGWNWESGFNKDAIKDGEWIRDYNFRAAFGMWDYLKNRSPDKQRYANAEMDWLGFVLGKRAARRIEGDYVLTEKDLTDHIVYKDGVVTTSWFLDLHFPHPMNEKFFADGAFRSIAYDDPRCLELLGATGGKMTPIKPYPIPFRCFYSRNVINLFMAGKDISCTHVAMASVRVENTTAQMGTMVGIAVSLCVKNDWTPRELGREHFDVLAESLLNPWRQSRLSRMGQGRRTLKDEILYHLRVLYHRFKKIIGRPYLEELVG